MHFDAAREIFRIALPQHTKPSGHRGCTLLTSFHPEMASMPFRRVANVSIPWTRQASGYR